MFPEDIQRLAQQIVATASTRGLMLATAESCTGGLVAAALTAVPGGGSDDKPVGLVHFAAQGPGGLIHRQERFGDIGRDAIRLASVRIALSLLADRLAS